MQKERQSTLTLPGQRRGDMPEELRWWRTLATVIGISTAGVITLRVNGWDLSRAPEHINYTALPPSCQRLTLGTSLLVWVAEGLDGELLLDRFERAPAPISESELAG